MRTPAHTLVLSLLAVMAAKATLVVIVPAKGATAVCADRRFVEATGKQFDADDKLQLLPPHAAYFVVGLEAVTAREKLLYSPRAVFQRYLAERAAQGISADLAIRDNAAINRYLREAFEAFLKEHAFPSPGSTQIDIEPSFSLGILRTESHLPHFTLFSVTRNIRKPATATSKIGHGMDGMFTRSDPMYVGQMDVVLGLAQRDPGFSRFNNDLYVKEFLLANFGMPLTGLDAALNASRRLISVTAEGLKLLPRTVPSVSSDSVCAVLDYAKEAAEYK